MAGDWIKMRNNLDDNPRVIELSELLNVPVLHAVGMLWKVWSWADEQSLDGNAVRVTYVTLDRYAGVSGFAKALAEVGWLEGESGNLTFPRFIEHNGKTAKTRANTAIRVSKHRNADSVTKALPEKRREEKSIIESNRSRIESNRPVSPVSSSRFGLMLADKLKPKTAIDLQFLTLVGRLVDERKLTEALAQSALVGCDKAKKPIAMFRSSLAGNVKAAGSDLATLLKSFEGESDAV